MPERSIDTGREATTGRDTYTDTTTVVRDATSVADRDSSSGREIFDRAIERGLTFNREAFGTLRDVTGRGIERFIDNTRTLLGTTRGLGERTLEYVDTVTSDNPVEEPTEPSVIDTVRSYLDQLGERQRDYPIAVIEGSGGESGISPMLLIIGGVIALVAFYFISRKGGA